MPHLKPNGPWATVTLPHTLAKKSKPKGKLTPLRLPSALPKENKLLFSLGWIARFLGREGTAFSAVLFSLFEPFGLKRWSSAFTSESRLVRKFCLRFRFRLKFRLQDKERGATYQVQKQFIVKTALARPLLAKDMMANQFCQCSFFGVNCHWLVQRPFASTTHRARRQSPLILLPFFIKRRVYSPRSAV